MHVQDPTTRPSSRFEMFFDWVGRTLVSATFDLSLVAESSDFTNGFCREGAVRLSRFSLLLRCVAG